MRFLDNLELGRDLPLAEMHRLHKRDGRGERGRRRSAPRDRGRTWPSAPDAPDPNAIVNLLRKHRQLAAETGCPSRPWEGSELSKLSRSHQAAPEPRDKSRLPKADYYCSPRLSSEIRELSRSPAATQHHGAARLAAVRCG